MPHLTLSGNKDSDLALLIYQPWTWPKRNMRRAATDFPNSMVLAARDLGSGTNRGSVPIDKIQHSNKPNRSPSVSLIQHISGGQEGGGRQGRKDERDSQLLPRYMTDILRSGGGHQKERGRWTPFLSCSIHPSIHQKTAHSALMIPPLSRILNP